MWVQKRSLQLQSYNILNPSCSIFNITICMSNIGFQQLSPSQPVLLKPLPCILQVVKIKFVHITLWKLWNFTTSETFLGQRCWWVITKRWKHRMLTEIIPHKPQKIWFARVYFSASSTSRSTSSFLGSLPANQEHKLRIYILF